MNRFKAFKFDDNYSKALDRRMVRRTLYLTLFIAFRFFARATTCLWCLTYMWLWWDAFESDVKLDHLFRGTWKMGSFGLHSRVIHLKYVTSLMNPSPGTIAQVSTAADAWRHATNIPTSSQYLSLSHSSLSIVSMHFLFFHQPSVDVQLHLPACMSWRRSSDEEKNPRESLGREFYS